MELQGYIIFVLYLQVSYGEPLTFRQFQLHHNKRYFTTAEQALREKIYNENLAKINVHNKKFEQGLVSYKLGVNQFTDMTEEEFVSRSQAFLDDDTELLQKLTFDSKLSPNSSLPASMDWRKKGIVTAVKDQGSCGSCWAFSTTGTLEGQLALLNGNLTSLSEQQLVDCDTNTNKGCHGGSPHKALKYYIRNYGLTTEKDYPYKSFQGICNSTKKSVVWVDGIQRISRNNETELKLAVGLFGPVSVGINAKPLHLYSSGIFNDSCPGHPYINHGVLIVGYGTDSKFGDFWIIKNSWGASWGENGYFRMAMGSNLCGIAYQACYPVGVRNTKGSTIVL